MTTKANWNYPTAVKFGAGRITEAAEHGGGDFAAAAGDRRGAGEPAGDAEHVETVEGCRDRGRRVRRCEPNPISANVNAGIDVLRRGGHDGVIAFGGGSGLDTGKVIAFMAGQTRPMWDFEDIGDWWTRADPKGVLSDRRGADDGGHGVGSRACRGDRG